MENLGLSREEKRLLTWSPQAAGIALFLALLTIDMLPRLRGRERRRARASLRGYRSTLRHFAGLCPENFQPMLELLEGELAAGNGEHEKAAAAFERGRLLATEIQHTWLVGLAAERLAKFGRKRGQGLLAEAAFDAAQQAYEAWGATAVVSRLASERAR